MGRVAARWGAGPGWVPAGVSVRSPSRSLLFPRPCELVPGCRARTVHATSWAPQYEFGVMERGQAGRPACRWGRRRALCSRCPPSSYLRAELVRCTLRARPPGTSSWMRVVPGRRRGWVVVWRPRRWWVSGPGAVRVSALAGEPAHRLLGDRGGEVAAALGDPAADQLGLVAHERETAP